MRFEYTGKAQEVMTRLFAFVEEWHKNNQGDEPLFYIKLWKEKRSLDQNAYYWLLLNRLARTLGYDNDQVHDWMLRSYGVHDVLLVDANVPLCDYFDHYDVLMTGYVDGRLYNHVRVFKGSSKMDRTEFSHLLEGLIQECRQQGIETRTPAEVAQMQYAESIA